MKTVIVGAGAIGTLLGAYMAKGGAFITMVDVPDVVKRLNHQDVEIKTLSGESFKARLKATHDPKSYPSYQDSLHHRRHHEGACPAQHRCQ